MRDVVLSLAAVLLVAQAAPVRAGGTQRVSVGPGGVQGNEASSASFRPAISADGRIVAFYSDATNLVRGDTNGSSDIFVRDSVTGRTTRVNRGPRDAQADGDSYFVALSRDGRFVAFDSNATNLVPGDTNAEADIFVRDRQTGELRRVSVGPGGAQADGGSFAPVISADGRLVAFASFATNLVSGDTNGDIDVFVHDRHTGVTTRASVGRGAAQGDGLSSHPEISADGRVVSFLSEASNLVPGDTNRTADVFVRDLRTGATTRASVGPRGVQADGESYSLSALSADGRFVAFYSDATNLVPGDTNRTGDVFVRDLRAGRTWRVSVGRGGAQADGGSFAPAISADGRFVAFQSNAANLVPGDTNGTDDVFVHDRQVGATTRASVGRGGVGGNRVSAHPALSADGRRVAFASSASNLTPGDTNGVYDVFVHER